MKRSPFVVVLSLLAALGCGPQDVDELALIQSELDACTELKRLEIDCLVMRAE